MKNHFLLRRIVVAAATGFWAWAALALNPISPHGVYIADPEAP